MHPGGDADYYLKGLVLFYKGLIIFNGCSRERRISGSGHYGK